MEARRSSDEVWVTVSFGAGVRESGGELESKGRRGGEGTGSSTSFVGASNDRL
jgi:hypothetical protein